MVTSSRLTTLRDLRAVIRASSSINTAAHPHLLRDPSIPRLRTSHRSRRDGFPSTIRTIRDGTTLKRLRADPNGKPPATTILVAVATSEDMVGPTNSSRKVTAIPHTVVTARMINSTATSPTAAVMAAAVAMGMSNILVKAMAGTAAVDMVTFKNTRRIRRRRSTALAALCWESREGLLSVLLVEHCWRMHSVRSCSLMIALSLFILWRQLTWTRRFGRRASSIVCARPKLWRSRSGI